MFRCTSTQASVKVAPRKQDSAWGMFRLARTEVLGVSNVFHGLRGR